jgi:hypothetical protein
MAWREALKKPVAKPTAPKPKFDTKDDDWETDINYEVYFCLFRITKKKKTNLCYLNRIQQMKNLNVMVQQVFLVLVE